MDEIDYKVLLQKYMTHVISCGGSSFIDSVEYQSYLSDDDKKVLKEIEKTVLKENFNG